MTHNVTVGHLPGCTLVVCDDDERQDVSKHAVYRGWVLKGTVVGLLGLAVMFMEKRHARECPRDETFGLPLDTWARVWLALWWTTGLLGVLNRVEWEFSGVMIATTVISCLWILVESGIVPGCTRLVVNCAATVSFMLLICDLVCDDGCG